MVANNAPCLTFSCRLTTGTGTMVFTHFSTPERLAQGKHAIRFTLPPHLLNSGVYRLSFGIDYNYLTNLVWAEDALYFEAAAPMPAFQSGGWHGIVRPAIEVSIAAVKG